MKVRRISIFFALALLMQTFLCAYVFAADSLPPDNPKYMAVKAVYDRIAAVYTDGREPPRLRVRPIAGNPDAEIAFFKPGTEGLMSEDQDLEESYISIDEKTYDILASKFGPDLNNALAVLVGHELTHFYKSQVWVGDFGNAFADMKVGKELQKVASYEEVQRMEAEADYFGGVYGYLAGYNTLGMAPKVLDVIYSNYRLPDKLPNYPSRAERKAIAERAEENLAKIIPIFDTGNRLLLLKKYDESARLFEYITRSFPSREIFNNAGVARSLAALDLFDKGTITFAYPFEFDAETRLKALRTRGFSGGNEERRKNLLSDASADFDKAIQRDKEYAVAYVNLASVDDLQGDHELSMRNANSGMELAKKKKDNITYGNALIIRGIAYANAGKKKDAVADLEEAKKFNLTLASGNMAVLDDPVFGYAQVDKAKKEVVSPIDESIGGVSTKDLKAMEPPDYTFTVKGEPSIKVFGKKTEKWEGMAISLDDKLGFIINTPDGYKGKTARGIKVGSTLSEVKDKYGDPARMVGAAQGNYAVYEKNGIIFEVSASGQINGWMVYKTEWQ